MKEQIAFAAIRTEHRLFVGTTHIEAEASLVREPGLAGEEKARLLLARVDGFLTDTGRFVFREEAFKIAAQAAQMIDHPCANDPAANQAFYGGDQPKLDSGLIKDYAPIRVPLESALTTARVREVTDPC